VNSRLHWSFEDPARLEGSEEEKLSKFREVRDEIETSRILIFRPVRPAIAVRWQARTWRIALEMCSQLVAVVSGRAD
jgi:hypothetical protein